MNRPHSKALYRYAAFTAGCTLLLIAAGGLVTSTGSGLSVPDWPLSYGTLNPPMIGGIRFEHSHRLIAGFVGILTFLLAAFTAWKEQRAWVKGLAFTAAGAVVLQAVLGGLTVIYLLPKPVSIAHACLAQSFFSLTVCLVYVLSAEWRQGARSPYAEASGFRKAAVIAAVLAWAQLFLGAVVRHTDVAGPVFPFHLILGLAFLFWISTLPSKAGQDDLTREALQPHALGIAALTLVQVFLGFGAFSLARLSPPGEPAGAAEVLFRTAHQTNGAVVLAGTILLALRAARLSAPGPKPALEPRAVGERAG